MKRYDHEEVWLCVVCVCVCVWCVCVVWYVCGVCVLCVCE